MVKSIDLIIQGLILSISFGMLWTILKYASGESLLQMALKASLLLSSCRKPNADRDAENNLKSIEACDLLDGLAS